MRTIARLYQAFLCALLTVPLNATEWPSGKYLNPTAQSLPRGELLAIAYSEVYFKQVEFKSALGDLVHVTYWDIQGTVGFRYAVSNHLEVGIRQVLYQDNHKVAPGFNLPDDLFLSACLNGFGPASGHLRLGAHLSARVPLAKYHNVVLEPYSAGRIELCTRGLLGVDTAPGSPDHGVAVDLAVGLLNHNDLGKRLTDAPDDSIAARSSSRQWLWAVGVTLRRTPFVFAVTLSGNHFLQQPPVTAYSRENYAYLSPSVLYRCTWWLTLGSALDVRLYNASDQTVYSGALPRVGHDFDNYPPWRLRLVAQLVVHSNRPHERTPSDKPPLPASNAPVNEEVVRQLAKEKHAAEEAEQELERIRQERERVARILNKLREIMAAQKPPAPPAEPPEKP
ncbi:MAG: hypothetical protein ONB30_03835 [candidate division KSB1 bacterium]|nr:hypothetical protein [candidate division KSB1 bacterium]